MNNVYPIRSYHHIGDLVQVDLGSEAFNGLVVARMPLRGVYHYRVSFGSGASLRLSQDDIVNNLTRKGRT